MNIPHLAWGNRGTLPVDVNEAEKVAKHILYIIREKDNEHYCALCDSIKVDPNIDLGKIEASTMLLERFYFYNFSWVWAFRAGQDRDHPCCRAWGCRR